MGAENWLLFKSPKEASRAKTFLAALSEEDHPFWLGWVSSKRIGLGLSSPMRLEIGVSSGSPPEIRQFVQREICRRFVVTRIGADSTGWWHDSDFGHAAEFCAGASYPGYTSWAAWAKDYKPEWSHFLPKRKYWPEDRFEQDYAASLAIVKEVEADVVKLFQRLDDDAGKHSATKE